MNNNAYAYALANTLAELQNACPDITHALIFKDNTLLAKTENTTNQAANNILTAFQAITERAETIGGAQTTTIEAAKGKITITRINDLQMTTVLTKTADEKYINALTRTIIPIIIKLSTQITPQEETQTLELEPIETTTEETHKTEENQEDTATLETQEEKANAKETQEKDTDENQDIAKPPVTQLIVENLSGLLVRGNIVQIDRSIIEEWNELYGEDAVKEVHIEALNGKTTRCKFKPIKDSKQEAKGIIKLPEKIQIEIEATEGDLVMVKPVVE